MRKNFNATCLELPKQNESSCVSSICFDEYGSYLAAAQDNELSVFAGKQWQTPQTTLKVDNTVDLVRMSNKTLTLITKGPGEGFLREFTTL